MRTHEEYRQRVEERLNELLAPPQGAFTAGQRPGLLNEAMRYSVMAGGKRLRPCMLLAACEMLGGDWEKALDYACAIEMIHTYSLIHDDLPGMDDDVLRRGKPTNHVVYGVGQAILAGDGLLNYAFEVMLKRALADRDTLPAGVSAIQDIACGAGVTGMIAGQVADLWAEREHCTEEGLLTYIHKGKTMAMFKGALRAGAHLANAFEGSVQSLDAYAESFGRLFQVTDDILDVTAEADKFGKSKGKDAAEGKLTAVSALGLEGAMRLSEELKNSALKALEPFGESAAYFIALTINMYERKH